MLKFVVRKWHATSMEQRHGMTLTFLGGGYSDIDMEGGHLDRVRSPVTRMVWGGIWHGGAHQHVPDQHDQP